MKKAVFGDDAVRSHGFLQVFQVSAPTVNTRIVGQKQGHLLLLNITVVFVFIAARRQPCHVERMPGDKMGKPLAIIGSLDYIITFSDPVIRSRHL